MRVLRIDGDFSDLRDVIIRLSETTTSADGNHRNGGWKSDRELAHWLIAREFVAQLKQQLAIELGTIIIAIDAWAMVHRDGSYHDWHEHGHGWAGVYYMTEGAATVFLVEGAEHRIEPHRVVPEKGNVILFPGNLRHRTEPHPGITPRVTIAFNVC